MHTRLACYLDDSGSDGENPIIAMGGYIAPIATWKWIERSVGAVLQGEGVPVLHAKHFQHTQGPFKGWSVKRKQSFISDVFDSMGPRLPFGLCHGVLKSNYVGRKSETGLAKNTSPFGFAFQMTFDSIVKAPMLADYIEANSAKISFNLEAGNKNNGDVIRVFNALKRTHDLPVLGRIELIDKKDSIAIQLADFLAYYGFRHMLKMVKQGPNAPFEAIFGILANRTPSIGKLGMDFGR